MAILSAAAQSVFEAIQRAAEAGTTFDRRINSDAVNRVQYNPITSVLHVQFTGNGIPYRFADVPVTLVAQFLASRSKGRFYHTRLKGKFEG